MQVCPIGSQRAKRQPGNEATGFARGRCVYFGAFLSVDVNVKEVSGGSFVQVLGHYTAQPDSPASLLTSKWKKAEQVRTDIVANIYILVLAPTFLALKTT